jgi:ribulose-5-phosphate 4-epimerase/fuculose-1-phosphate aldolase
LARLGAIRPRGQSEEKHDATGKVLRSRLAGLALLAANRVPAMTQTPAADAALIDDLVAANRILFDQGVVDGFGHVSARHDKNSERFLLARSMAPGLVTAADIMEFDLDGNAIDAKGRAVYLERFIHSEIYKTHPEVNAIVHSHSPAVIPFGVAGLPLRPIFHLSGFLGGTGVPIFEIRDAGGPATDMLIRNPELGAALAKKLGIAPVVLMRGHGDVVVAGSVQEVVFRAVYTEVNARLEAEALRLAPIGQITFLNDQEAANAAATNAGVLGRAWELWKARAMGGSR